jgi:hypothetical protein
VVDVNPSGDLIDEYLDVLFTRLRTKPRNARRILAEAEDHLREAAAEGLAAGLSEREAQEQAISSFGSVRAVVRAHDRRPGRFPLVAMARDLVMSGWMLGGLGLVAVGISGLVASAMNDLFGRRFVGGAPAAAGFPAAACRHFLAVQPAARSCAQAAMLENSHDAVALRVLAGIAGLVLMLAYYLTRRDRSRSVLPEGFVPAVAVSVFGAAGLGLAWLSASNAVVGRSTGPGFFLSGAIVALAVAAFYLRPLQRTLLRHARG